MVYCTEKLHRRLRQSQFDNIVEFVGGPYGPPCEFGGECLQFQKTPAGVFFYGKNSACSLGHQGELVIFAFKEVAAELKHRAVVEKTSGDLLQDRFLRIDP